MKISLMVKRLRPTLDSHMLLLFFKLKQDTMLKKSQFQVLLPLQPLLLLTLIKRELRVKQPLSMLKNLKISSMVELIRPTPNFHMPLLFFKLDTMLKKFQFQDL